MSNSSDGDLESRLAILEERTRPKPRTLFDRIKDWSGVSAFVVAVLYTYPLGFWDRFVVTARQEKAQQVAELRSLILKLGEIDADFVRTFSSVSDLQVRSLLSQVE